MMSAKLRNSSPSQLSRVLMIKRELLEIEESPYP